MRGLAIEPREEARHGGTVAAVGRARALDLDRILDGLHEHDRIGAARNLAAGRRDGTRKRIGGGRLVELQRAAGGAECGQIAGECRGLVDIRELFEPIANGRDLHFVELARGFLAVARDERNRGALGEELGGGGDLKDFDALVRKADEMLYEAKRAGRNCVRVAKLP